MNDSAFARLAALAGYLFDAQTIQVLLKNDAGQLEPAPIDYVKGFREMVRVQFDDVAGLEAKAKSSGGGDREPFTPGAYEVQITEAKYTTSRNNNQGVSLLLADGDHSGWFTVWFTEGNKPNVMLFAKSLGCEIEEGTVLNLTPEAIKGRSVLVTFEEQDYDGQLSIAVKWLSWRSPKKPNPAWVDYPSETEIENVNDEDIPF